MYVLMDVIVCSITCFEVCAKTTATKWIETVDDKGKHIVIKMLQSKGRVGKQYIQKL